MIAAVLTLLLGIVVVLVIIGINGYFVAQEFAYMSVDRNRLRAQAEAGDSAAARALKVTERTSFMLSGAQLGITVTGLLVGYVAEPLIGQSLGTLLGGTGIPAAASIAVATVGVLAVSTVVQMIFGELFPKNYAIANPVPLAKGLAASTRIYLTVFGWLISFFDLSANALLRLLRIEPVHDVDSSATAADLEHIVSSSREAGELPEELYLVLDRVLDFPDHDVEHAMIPRSRAGTVQPRTTVGEVRELMATEHTRYPVIDEDDQPVGVVHLIDLLGTQLSDQETVSALMREPIILPTLMPLPDAVRRLAETKAQMACVIDEYGGFVGVITVEDLAEEILGEITDEHDDGSAEQIRELAPGRWEAEADIHLDEVERHLGHQLPAGDYETVSGLLIAQEGGLLAEGRVMQIELPPDPADFVEDPVRRAAEIHVLSVERNVPSRIEIRLIEEQAQEGDEA